MKGWGVVLEGGLTGTKGERLQTLQGPREVIGQSSQPHSQSG